MRSASAHRHGGRGAFVGGDGVVEVQLARGVLLVERADAFQVAVGLEFQSLVFVQLCLRLVYPGFVELGVDDEQRLPLLDVGSLLEKHFFEKALHPGADFDELLGADASHVFAVEFDVVGFGRLDLDHGQYGFYGFGAQPPPKPSDSQYGYSGQDQPGAFRQTADSAACLFAELQRTAAGAGRLLHDFLV